MPKPSIVIERLRKEYGEKLVLDDINLSVSEGQIVGYIGPNGAGKSTTVKILTGIISDFDGIVNVLGFDLKTEPIEIKKRIGYVPENAELYDLLTPLEYLTFIGSLFGMGEDQIHKKAKKLLALFDLSESVNSRMDTFSKGMRQKVLIISGLIHHPEILFLDEPLSGLDANSVILLKNILTQYAEAGKTVFYSSHMMDIVEKISDRILLIKQGKIIANGSFEELNATYKESLEQLFSRLTGSSDQEGRAKEFIETIAN